MKKKITFGGHFQIGLFPSEFVATDENGQDYITRDGITFTKATKEEAKVFMKSIRAKGYKQRKFDAKADKEFGLSDNH